LKHIQTQAFLNEQKDLAGLLLNRSERMDSEKKALLRLILDRGATYGQVARLSGEHASTVSRRFRSMLRKLKTKPLHKTNKTMPRLSPLEKTILIELFVYGTTQKDIAAKLGISRYRVRKTLNSFKATARSASAGINTDPTAKHSLTVPPVTTGSRQ
jgi:DNA-directed RNA polymerase specialized sigma subunit